jgi:chaperonin GroES
MKQEVSIESTEFQPRKDYILVNAEELQDEKVTESGLVISLQRSSLERPTIGQIIAVGVEIEDLKIGDTVMWPQTDGIDIAFTDGDRVLLRYESILGSKK